MLVDLTPSSAATSVIDRYRSVMVKTPVGDLGDLDAQCRGCAHEADDAYCGVVFA